METIHSRIRQRRDALKLSQPELAKRIGVTYQSVQQWEREPVEGTQSTAPNRRRLPLVAAALGVSEHWLLTGKEESGQESDPNLDQLITLYRAMDPEWKAYLLEQANHLFNRLNPDKKTRANPFGGKTPPGK